MIHHKVNLRQMIHDVIFHLGKCIFKFVFPPQNNNWMRSIQNEKYFCWKKKKNVRSTLLAAPTKIDPQLHFEFFMWVWVLQCWTSSKSLGNCKNNGLMANHHNCNIGRLKVLGLFYYMTLLFIDYQIHALIQYFSLSTMKASIAKYLAKVKRGKNRDAQ